MTTKEHVEDHGVISGIGISRIGRRTGVPGIDLTMQAVGAASHSCTTASRSSR